MTPIKVFFCYAREDNTLVRILEKQLKALRHQGLIDIWYDREINPGMEWEQEIGKHLNTSQVILLLISPDFMDSEYCYGVEMKRAMERHDQGEACVIPIILRPVYWKRAPFGKLQALPTDARYITSPHWHNLDEAFFDIAEGIRKIINSLQVQQVKALGDTYILAGHHKEALAVYEEAICMAPNDASLYYNKGVALFDLKRYDEALEAFQQVITLNPNDAKAFNNKGSLLGLQKHYKEALIAFNQAILLGLKNTDIYMNKYYALEELHLYIDALETLEQAFELDHKIAVSRSLYVRWASQLLKLPNLAFLEIDTTGIYEEDEIIRFLLVNSEGSVLLDTFICAGKNLFENISNMTGITDQDLNNAPTIIDVWENIKQAISGKHIISFNLNFDQGMLEVATERYGLEMPTFVGACLMKKAMMYSRSFSYSKLSSLCAFIGQDLPKYPHQTALHRAMGQLAILKAISQDVNIQKPDLEDESPINFYINSQSSKFTEELSADFRFNKYTKQAMNVLKSAREEVLHFKHKYISTAHLFLGLLLEREGLSAKIFANLSIKPNTVYHTIKLSITYGNIVDHNEIGMTARAKRVIELASEEALNQGHFYIGTEYLLLGLMKVEDSITAKTLKSQNINFKMIQEEVLKLYNQKHL